MLSSAFGLHGARKAFSEPLRESAATAPRQSKMTIGYEEEGAKAIMKKLALVFGASFTLGSPVSGDSPTSDQIINIGSHRLQARLKGNGAPTVVIDAGIGDDFEKLWPLQERISHVTRVVTYNRAGYGQSEPGPLPRHSGREAEELRVLLERA